MEQTIKKAVDAGASDVHIGQDGRVFFRLLGRMQALASEEIGELDPILTQLEAWEKEGASATMSRSLRDGSRLRIHAYEAQGERCWAIRILPRQAQRLKSLALPLAGLKLHRLRSGLLLVVGATGSGKTTSLAALLQELAMTAPRHILTFEDPIEILIESSQSLVHQCELGRDFPDYPTALRSAVRSDPDIIMLGEIRDEPTARAALSLAETGHLVLSSLHASSAADAILRLLDLFPADHREHRAGQLAACLQAVLYQELHPHKDQQQRIAIGELLLASPAVARLIREQSIHQLANLISAASEEGMVEFDQSLARAVQEARLAYDDARLWAREPQRLKKRLEQLEEENNA